MSEIIAADNGVAVPDNCPTDKYGAILADPPWRFRTWSERNQSRAASRHYSLMTLGEITAMPVADLAAPDCGLFLWVTRPMLREAFMVAEAWGFEFKTVALTWTKTAKYSMEHMGLGYWSRADPEHRWLFTRGKPKRLPTRRSVREWISVPVREHSRRPDWVHERIERPLPRPCGHLPPLKCPVRSVKSEESGVVAAVLCPVAGAGRNSPFTYRPRRSPSSPIFQPTASTMNTPR